ncbi:Pcl6p LALA0_S01e02212g [Lachancea lanzarotensis]|uniref:LALA0S01e02212g1_1 n=1 Tax=Lachancea lanzarotensis TaxID=1245769 RepID=A0A0C7MS68_9SACH|nr:uncharacterized protein LALA0_S01e02212g [Lachancea lanzarotensis]CEP60064.1 LALA0S01e02212g1_1 [Lachancea lanzarotensis]
MARRPSFLDHISDNDKDERQRSRPMQIPRQAPSVHSEGGTSVTEETFSSSHSSESYVPAEDHPLSKQSSQQPNSQNPSQQFTEHESCFRVASNVSQLSGIAHNSPRSFTQRKRPSFGRRRSSFSRGSFVGHNGSFISTSLKEDLDPTTEELRHGSFGDDSEEELFEPDTTVENTRETSSATAERETTIFNTELEAKDNEKSEAPHGTKFFQNSAPSNDDLLQQYTPFHNVPTSTSKSYSTNKSIRGLIGSRQKEEVEPEPRLSEDPELIEIANFPTDLLLDMLTALLDKIVQSNDLLHRDKSPGERPQESQIGLQTPTYSMGTGMFAELLSFRGKHVPAITLQQYFQRIQKYCPTTNDVFLSLLVYFDRIAKACNNGKEQTFVMDSFNIHRLIISAVTVSTKFFSDFFYSNSRYARVGGISLKELNHLELQFLVLCDFELIISVEELQKYGVLLRDFWQREQGELDPAIVV